MKHEIIKKWNFPENWESSQNYNYDLIPKLMYNLYSDNEYSIIRLYNYKDENYYSSSDFKEKKINYAQVTPEKLVAAGIVKSLRHPIKILAEGDINHPLVVKANKFSAAARAKIEAAGGKAEEVGYAAKTN